MQSWAVAAVVGTAALIVAGCGASSHRAAVTATARPTSVASAVPASAAAKLPGYLAVSSNGAMFLQWQRSGGYVHGTMSESYYDQSSPTQLRASSGSFTGSITGQQISITFDSGSTWSGVLSGSTLTLSYTDSDGALQTLDFHPGNAAVYNAFVAATKSQVAGAQTRAKQQQAVESAHQQIDTDASHVGDDLQTLQGDATSLASDTFDGDLQSIRSDVQTVSQDLQTVRSDSSDVACSDAGVAASDAGVAANDEAVLHNDAAAVYANDIQRALGDIATLRADQQTLANDQTADFRYASPNEPSAASIGSAVRSVHAAIADLRTRTKQAGAKAAQLVSRANGIAAQAHQAGCG